MTPPDEWKTYQPDPSPDGEPTGSAEPSVPPTPPAPTRPPADRTVKGRPALVPVLVAVVVLGLVGWGAVAIIRNIVEPDEPQKVDGFAALVDDIRDETGSTEVFRAVLYPGYAVVSVPYAKGNDDRELSFYWDGGLADPTKSTSDEETFDLATIDASLFAGMCKEVSSLVDDPEDCYLIIDSPDQSTPDAPDDWIAAYVSNEFGQSARISYDRAGEEVARTGN